MYYKHIANMPLSLVQDMGIALLSFEDKRKDTKSKRRQ